jgi:hypothetical protein
MVTVPSTSATPVAPPPGASRHVRRPVVAVVASLAFLVVATAVQLWRVPGVYVWRTVWAEDALVFYQDALDGPLTETLFKPYAGYGHAVPRMLATVGSWLPPGWYSAWVALSSTVVVSLLALFIYFASAPLLRAPLRRGILAGSLLVLPVLPLEVLAALCNLHWVLPIGCLFAVLFPVEGRAGIAVRIVIVVLAPLTSPLSMVFAPIALYQLVAFLRRRDPWWRFLVPVVYLAACAGQLLVYLGAEQSDDPRPPLGDVAGDIVDVYQTHVLLDGGLGTRVTSEIWPETSSWLAWTATALVLVLLAVKLSRAGRIARWWIVGFAAASAAVFAFSMVQRSELVELMLSSAALNLNGSRYGVFPQFLLLVALLVPPAVRPDLLLGAGPERTEATVGAAPAGADRGRLGALTGGHPWIALGVLTAAWLAVAIVPSYRQDVSRSKGPAWPSEVADAQATCREGGGEVGIVELSPAPDWRFEMTCAELDVDGR